MDESNNSSVTISSSDFKSATLDQLYKEQISELRSAILKTTTTSDIEMCRKWLEIFTYVPTEDKIERNCLATLMQQQIQDYGCLGSPFTNPLNLKKSLKKVMQEMDNTSYASSNSVGVETFNSHNMKNIAEEVGCDQNKTSETAVLKVDLENLRLLLAEKQAENAKLNEIIKSYEKQPKNCKQTLDAIKNDILDSIRDNILQMDEAKEVLQNLKLFQNVFRVHSDDKEFMAIVQKFDVDLVHVLKRHIKYELKKQKVSITRQLLKRVMKKEEKTLKKYENRLALQEMAHKLQLKLEKLKCFSALRQIFMRSHNDIGKVDLWFVLKILEDKYQAVVNGL